MFDLQTVAETLEMLSDGELGVRYPRPISKASSGRSGGNGSPGHHKILGRFKTSLTLGQRRRW